MSGREQADFDGGAWRMVPVGALCLGECDGAEVGEWETDMDQAKCDEINESLSIGASRVVLYAMVPADYAPREPGCNVERND